MLRILVVQSDPLIAHLLRTRLENAGLAVATATTVGEARKIVAEASPDLVVLDHFLPDAQSPALLRSLNFGTPRIPSVVFTNPLTRLGAIAEAAGATYSLEEDAGNPAAMMDALGACMGPALLPDARALLADPSPDLERYAIDRTLADAERSIEVARRALQPLVRGKRDLRSVYAFACAAHTLSARTAFAGLRGAYRIASVVEALALDCQDSPARLGPSTLRTLSQTLDLLRLLLAPENLSAARDARPASVFCVDDEPDIRAAVRESLEPVGARVASAANAREAIAHLDQHRADLVFLDIGLPDLTGFELCARIRDLLFHEKTPVVFLTGLATFQNRAQSKLSGGDDFMPKPFGVWEICLKTLYWINRPRLVSVQNPPIGS